MEKKVRIRVIGSINMDLVMQMERVPKDGETVLGRSYFFAPGGKGGNASVAAARLGGEVSFAGCVGNDIYGRELTASLQKEGIDTKLLSVSQTLPSGFAPIFVQDDGQNRIIAFPAANRAMTKEDAPSMLEGDYDAVMMQLEIDQELVIEAANCATEKGIPVVLDAGPSQPFPLERIKGIEILSPNETETQALCGIFPKDEESMLASAQILQKRSDCKYVVLKLGARGAYIYGQGMHTLIPAFSIQALDPTAAGDAFTGAMTLKYCQTKDITAAVYYGNAAGALTATKIGAQPSLPTQAEVECFLKKQ